MIMIISENCCVWLLLCYLCHVVNVNFSILFLLVWFVSVRFWKEKSSWRVFLL